MTRDLVDDARQTLDSVSGGGFGLDHRRLRAGRNRRQHVLFPFDQRYGIVAGHFEAVAMSDGIGGAGFHAITAEDAAVVIDAVNAGVTLTARDAKPGGV